MSQSSTEILDESICWTLLRAAEVGRLAVLIDGVPDIFPVNYVVDHGAVVFRTAPGSKLDASLGAGVVAFEADGVDAEDRAWSVVLQGAVSERRTLEGALEAAELPLFPWHGDAKPRFLRITPDRLSGRRFRRADRDRWSSVFMEPTA